MKESSDNQEILQKLLAVFQLPKAFTGLNNEKKLKLNVIGIDPNSIEFAKDYKLSEWKKNILGEAKNYLEPIAKQKSTIFTPNKISEELENFLIEYCGGINKVKEDKQTQNLLVVICTEMQNYLSKESALIKGMDRVKSLLITNKIGSEEEIEIKENPDKGANDSFITKIKGDTYYIKNCSDDSNILGKTDGKVHPNELLVYKIMEYSGFGPEAKFLFGKYSSSGGNSSSCKGNYIMTKSLNEKDKRFLIDIEDNYQEFQNALKDKDFSVELSAASVLNDLLSLTDTFGRNTRNYGLVVNTVNNQQIQGNAIEEEFKQGKEVKKYTLQFVDHLPNANNGLFSLDDFKPELYSPRKALQTKSNQLDQENHSAFKDISANRNKFEKIILGKSVNERLLNFKEALGSAQNDINILIEKYPENFIADAKSTLNKYCNKIEENLKVYNKTTSTEK